MKTFIQMMCCLEPLDECEYVEFVLGEVSVEKMAVRCQLCDKWVPRTRLEGGRRIPSDTIFH